VKINDNYYGATTLVSMSRERKRFQKSKKTPFFQIEKIGREKKKFQKNSIFYF